jgi:glycosyltransferase involved in cell wall biosynthesis
LVTIHDAIPELFPKLVFPTWRSKLFWYAKAKLGAAQARLILTVSDYSRRCLIEQLGISPERLRVVNEATDPAFRPLEHPNGRVLRARWGLSPATRFLVYAGGFSPHKNLSLLVDVFRELLTQPQFVDLHLVLVGDYEGDVFHSCYLQLRDQVRQSGLQARVLFTGYLGDDDLVVLLNLAEALVLPSFSEGFGLPGIESAACGTPVVATTRSPLPELLGEGAIAVEPNDRAGWRDAIARVLSDNGLRARMRAAGLAAVGRLSWQDSARQLLSIFEEVWQSRVAPA